MAEESADELKLVQGRSPAYPFIDLGRAIERIELVVKAGGTRQQLPPETFYKIWGIGAQSSASRQILAALNHFGLVEYIGRGNDRKVKLTDLALRIVLDKQPNSAERKKAVREAALTPPVHAELFERFGPMLPADVVIETYLTRDRGYNGGAAESLIAEYKTTLDYSGLDQPEDLTNNLAQQGIPAAKPERPKVGEYVQWESAGVLQFSSPRKVIGISDAGDYAFVEGSQTGVPMSELSIVAPPAGAGSGQPAAPPLAPAASGTRQDVFNLDEGPVVLNYPVKMSAESYEDFEGWIHLQLKKIKRGIAQ